MDLQNNNDISSNNDYDYWKNYRKNLTSLIKDSNKVLEKTPYNIVKLAKEIGVKPTSRYFNIAPATVRSYLKKDL